MRTTLTDENIRRNIAANVLRLMNERGWTQVKLADESSESQPKISQIINGMHLPNAAILLRIASALGCTIDDLVNAPARNSTRQASAGAR